MAEDNPILKTLPPELDYISYLTVLEYNLTAEQLPVLHNVLQDPTLTANIGWDLVHLLLPLLPGSQTCLQDVARLGNPREVVLKVTELLEGLTIPEEAEGEEQVEDEEEDHDELAEGLSDLAIQEAKVIQTEQPAAADPIPSQHVASLEAKEQETAPEVQELPSKIVQFSALVDMLAILHPRIKTKHPSRFLSTSLQAVLPAYATLLKHDETTETLLTFVKAFVGTRRPQLPPRKSSTQILTQIQTQNVPQSAPDPEGTDESLAPEEDALQRKLLQSFLTFVVEGYISSLPFDDDVVAMSWSTRLQEHLHPNKSIPGREMLREAFEHDEALHRRDSVIGQMLALARDLNLSPSDLIQTLTSPEESSENDDEPDNLPSSAADVPHSRPGCLYLLCATIASTTLFHAPSTVPPLAIFPTYSTILSNHLSNPSSPSVGTEAPSAIDGLLFLGIHILETTGLVQPPKDDKMFTDTLRLLSLLSANTPFAPLRYNAHVLTSRILHTHPNDQVRLSFIKDTLEHCPYENLKASAVGWLKDEIIAANSPLSPATGDTANSTNLFTTPTCLSTLSSHLFLSPSSLSTEAFQAHIPFFLAALNLYYFLLSMPGLAEQ
ncbi:MAG: hypothetical protein Q9218_006992, partial [Villophora microphyllina]